jgi:hypothetical protein
MGTFGTAIVNLQGSPLSWDQINKKKVSYAKPAKLMAKRSLINGFTHVSVHHDALLVSLA